MPTNKSKDQLPNSTLEHSLPELGLAFESFGARMQANELHGHGESNLRPEILQGNPVKADVRDSSLRHINENTRTASDDAAKLRAKHGPAEISAKTPTTRKRSIIPIEQPKSRDPRFESTTGHLNPNKLESNYAFLNAYEDTEIADLQDRIGKTKDVGEKDSLDRTLRSLLSRRQAKKMKSDEQAIRSSHRKREMSEIGKGKRPFHLKRQALKQAALSERLSDLKAGNIKRIMRRKRDEEARKRSLRRVLH